MGALVWWLVGRGLWPVRHLAAQLEGVSPEHLQPVSVARYPVEMLPILGALNGLLQRLDRALQLERQFTADAAHELRTPLAGIRAQAQVAQRALEPEVRERALRQVVAGVDRQTQLVTQLLQLARLEPGAVLEPSTPQNLRVLVEEVLRDAVPAALEKGITLEFEEGPAPQVTVRPELFRVLLRNLVDNALRYTPAGGRVLLWLDASGDRTQLSVEDSGPGIPLEERERVFDRFYRRVGSGESGSGLGLAIVRRVAELLSVQVRLDTARSGQGLWVRVDFPQR
jgi:signal transduction histidine kinase